MMTDGIKNKEKRGEVQVMDIAELMQMLKIYKIIQGWGIANCIP
jgi:hypothetical protein